MVHLVLETGAHRRPKPFGRDRSGRRSQPGDPVLERADPPARCGQDGGRNPERVAATVVNEVRAIGVASEDDHDETEVSLQRLGLAPGPEQLQIDPGDDGRAGVQASIERFASTFCAPGLMDVGLDAEPIERLAGPAGDPRVLPLVPESEGEHRPSEALELPQDVAGAQPAADPEDRGLGQRLAGQPRDDALVCQDVGQRGRLRVQAAAHLVARCGGGAGRQLGARSARTAREEGPSGGGVALAGLGHARTHDPLEGLVGGHRSVLRHGRRRTRPHRHVVGRSDGRPARPEDLDPLYRRIAAPRGGSVWQSGAGARRHQCTTLWNPAASRRPST